MGNGLEGNLCALGSSLSCLLEGTKSRLFPGEEDLGWLLSAESTGIESSMAQAGEREQGRNTKEREVWVKGGPRKLVVRERGKNTIAKTLQHGLCGSCTEMFPLACFGRGTGAGPWRG